MKTDLILRKDRDGKLVVGIGCNGKVISWLAAFGNADNVQVVLDGFKPEEVLERTGRLLECVKKQVEKSEKDRDIKDILAGKRVYIDGEETLMGVTRALRARGFEGGHFVTAVGTFPISSQWDVLRSVNKYWLTFPSPGKFKVIDVYASNPFELAAYEKISLKELRNVCER